MKVLVTGGTGKVGSEVIKELVKGNVSVRALVRKQETSTKMPKGVEIIQGDLLDPISLRKAADLPLELSRDPGYSLAGALRPVFSMTRIAFPDRQSSV
jgi:nucleoside-diphosphate-sugar epimerase